MTSPTCSTTTSGTQFVTGASAASFVPSKPSGSASGHVLLAIYYLEATGAITMPTGFTSVLDVTNSGFSPTSRMRVDWKIADGTEGATLTWSWTGSQWRMGCLHDCAGTATSGTPVELGNTANNGNATGTASPNVALTGNVSVDGLVFLGSFNGGVTAGNWTAPGTWTLQKNFAADDMGIITIAQAAGGAPATTHVTLSTTPTGNVGSVVISVMSPAGGAGGGLPFFMQEENLMVGGLGRKSGGFQ